MEKTANLVKRIPTTVKIFLACFAFYFITKTFQR